jgi:hypothetical protein
MTMPARPSFSGLRGARWRADLGVLPGSAAVSIDELRRAAADSRRRSGLEEFLDSCCVFDAGDGSLE